MHRELPMADRVVRAAMVALAGAVVVGATIVLAPVAFAGGWWSALGLQFIFSTLATTGLTAWTVWHLFDRRKKGERPGG